MPLMRCKMTCLVTSSTKRPDWWPVATKSLSCYANVKTCEDVKLDEARVKDSFE